MKWQIIVPILIAVVILLIIIYLYFSSYYLNWMVKPITGYPHYSSALDNPSLASQIGVYSRDVSPNNQWYWLSAVDKKWHPTGVASSAYGKDTDKCVPTDTTIKCTSPGVFSTNHKQMTAVAIAGAAIDATN